MSAETIAQNWAFAVYVAGAIAICLGMIGLASVLGGRAWGGRRAGAADAQRYPSTLDRRWTLEAGPRVADGGRPQVWPRAVAGIWQPCIPPTTASRGNHHDRPDVHRHFAAHR